MIIRLSQFSLAGSPGERSEARGPGGLGAAFQDGVISGLRGNLLGPGSPLRGVRGAGEHLGMEGKR